MRLELEKTNHFFMQSGLPARLWIGKTDAGIEVEVLITAIKAKHSQNLQTFDAELKKIRHIVAVAKSKSREKRKRNNILCSHGLGGTLCEECHPCP